MDQRCGDHGNQYLYPVLCDVLSFIQPGPGLPGEEEKEDNKKSVEYYALKVVAVEDSGDWKGKDIWYNVKLENGWVVFL